MLSSLMDESLRLIRARRTEIAKQRDTIQLSLRALDKEDAELEAAERVIVRLSGTKTVSAAGGGGGKISQRDAVISALKLSTDPWFPDLSSLREEASRLYGQEIAQTTFQPLLSQMTNKDRIIVRDGPKAALAERVSTNANGGHQ